MKTYFFTQRQVSWFGLGTGHRSWGSRVGIWNRARGPGMHLWNGPWCSRVRWRWWARLRWHTDHPSSRRDILEGEERKVNRNEEVGKIKKRRRRRKKKERKMRKVENQLKPPLLIPQTSDNKSLCRHYN